MPKKDQVAARARAIYDRLMKIRRPEDLSNNEWAKRAGVNTSFFTNLKKGSEPSVGNLRAILEVVGVTLPEFFLNEALSRLIPAPSPRALEQAILDALPGLPRRPERRAEYLAATVLRILRLPDSLQANPAMPETGAADDVPGLPTTRPATTRG